MKKFIVTAYYTRTEDLKLEVEIEANSEEEAEQKFLALDACEELPYGNLEETGEMSTELYEDDISVKEIK